LHLYHWFVCASGATITTGLNPRDPHEKHITKIDLSSQDIEGVIPYSLFLLTKLKVLDLSCNRLSGPVPASIGHMDGLQELRLQHNYLRGTIPFALGGLQSMHHPYSGAHIEEPKTLDELDSDHDDDALLDEKPHVRFQDRTPEEKQLSAVMEKRPEMTNGFRYERWGVCRLLCAQRWGRWREAIGVGSACVWCSACACGAVHVCGAG
jgi:hypothetical protein